MLGAARRCDRAVAAELVAAVARAGIADLAGVAAVAALAAVAGSIFVATGGALLDRVASGAELRIATIRGGGTRAYLGGHAGAAGAAAAG